jgi:hypothetical protein
LKIGANCQVCNKVDACGANKKCDMKIQIEEKHKYFDCEVQGELRPLLGSNLTGYFIFFIFFYIYIVIVI